LLLAGMVLIVVLLFLTVIRQIVRLWWR